MSADEILWMFVRWDQTPTLPDGRRKLETSLLTSGPAFRPSAWARSHLGERGWELVEALKPKLRLSGLLEFRLIELERFQIRAVFDPGGVPLEHEWDEVRRAHVSLVGIDGKNRPQERLDALALLSDHFLRFPSP